MEENVDDKGSELDEKMKRNLLEIKIQIQMKELMTKSMKRKHLIW